MILDRSVGPPIKPITKLQIPKVESHVLSNGLTVFCLNAGTQDILKLELINHAGRSNELQKLGAKVYAGTVKEGTSSMRSSEIAAKIDFYGATISSSSGMDSSSMTLYTLNKHLESILPVFIDLLVDPVFPEEEIEKYKKRSAEKLALELTKSDVLAYRKITEIIFGEEHAYGYNSYPETYNTLGREVALRHHREKILTKDSFAIISGRITTEALTIINNYLEQIVLTESSKAPIIYTGPVGAQRFHGKGKYEFQTAIRIGKQMFNRHHTDFSGMYLVNTLFGGYFGSRLMSSIREEKGYTYGIFSMIDAMKEDGYFYISTEVANKYVKPTMEAIREEVDILQNERVSKDELQMVKNYIMGSFMTMIDGPFKTSEVLKTLIIGGKDFEYLEGFFDEILQITDQEIQNLANKHLNLDTMHHVTVGDYPENNA